MRLAKYEICACGLGSDTVGGVTLDERVALVQPHPLSTLYLCPLRNQRQPTYSEAWFYADCISYEHDIPAIVYPQKSEIDRFGYRFVHSGPSQQQEHTIVDLVNNTKREFVRNPISPREVSKRWYIDQLVAVLELTRDLRHGPLTYVLFRTYDEDEQVDLPYSKIYRSVEKEISLYTSAIRQSDALSEYLGYYRVIESTTRTNGKEWIQEKISKIRDHDFGSIAIKHDLDTYQDKPRNIMGTYRRRALLRYAKLLKIHGNDKSVADYLYSVNRCGIAHGKDAVVRAEIAPTYFEVVRDATILKMLARMAIDEKRKLT